MILKLQKFGLLRKYQFQLKVVRLGKLSLNLFEASEWLTVRDHDWQVSQPPESWLSIFISFIRNRGVRWPKRS